jgi:hypothetical protein
LILGEFGAPRDGPDGPTPQEWHPAFLSDKRRAAEAEGFGWAVWNLVGDMGIDQKDDADHNLAPESCAALGLSACAP